MNESAWYQVLLFFVVVYQTIDQVEISK